MSQSRAPALPSDRGGLVLLSGGAVLGVVAGGVVLALGLPGALVASSVLLPVLTAAVVGWLRAARRDEPRFTELFDALASPAALVEPGSLLVRRANRSLAELAATGFEQLEGAPLTDLLDDGDAAAVRSLARAVTDGVADRRTTEVTLTSRHTSRAVRLALARSDALGPRPVLLVSAVDLTEERVRSESLRRSREALDRFAGRLGHDLKSPLAVLATFARSLREDDLPPDVRARLLTRLDVAATRAAEQVDEMLRAARRTADRAEPVQLTEVVAWLEELLALPLAAVGGVLRSDVPPEPVTVDRDALRQVLLNLGNNAIAYRHPSRPLLVVVEAATVGGGLRVTVTDTGRGIPDHRLEDVFEPGVRLAPDTAGSGSGLTAARRLAELAGGFLTGVPHDDGACFVLWLPLHDASTAVVESAVAGLPVELGARASRSGELDPA